MKKNESSGELDFLRYSVKGALLVVFKRSFLRERVTYVGHQVSEGGISRNPDKVAAVAEWKVPYSYSVIELGLFLGFQARLL